MVSLHPKADLLTEYCAGSLSPAQGVAISAHLHFCANCRDSVSALEEVGGVLLESAPPFALDAAALVDVLAQIEAPRAASAPLPRVDPELAGLPVLIQRLVPGDGVRWRYLSPSLKVARMPIGETRFELALHKIKAGGRAPAHDHNGLEITVVLAGSFSDDDGVYHAGDFILREPGDIHTPIATQNAPCICLSACEAPIRMTGTFKRLLNPLLGFMPG